MTFIPIDPQIGDRVRLTQDVKMLTGTYTKGHEFVITGFHERGVDLRDDEGRNLTEIHPGFHGGKFPFETV